MVVKMVDLMCSRDRFAELTVLNTNFCRFSKVDIDVPEVVILLFYCNGRQKVDPQILPSTRRFGSEGSNDLESEFSRFDRHARSFSMSHTFRMFSVIFRDFYPRFSRGFPRFSACACVSVSQIGSRNCSSILPRRRSHLRMVPCFPRTLSDCAAQGGKSWKMEQ